jgi:NAD(P)-dependent dehydrogenase (short-subunit alcohol dehydrogenase family)
MSQSTDRIAIVTGASQGIGAGLVEALIEKGYGVVATSRTIKEKFGPNVVTVAGDVADRQTAERAVAAALDHFGRIDSLINNAGIFISKPFVDYTPADYAAVMSVNVEGFFHMTQKVLSQMLRQGSGHVVNITTTLVDQPLKAVPAGLASLSKGALDAITRGLAIEYSDKGVRVNAVAPGIIRTPMHSPESHEFLSKLHPIQRLGEVQEIVDAILYLESAPFVTGQTLHVDGGASAGRW